MKQTVYMGRGRQKGQKCAPVCTKNPEAFRALASRANVLDSQELNAAKYLMKLADWLESPEYLEAKAKRMHFKKLRMEKKNAAN
jgi:hypothetical protein